jgi:hypothetical protein
MLGEAEESSSPHVVTSGEDASKSVPEKTNAGQISGFWLMMLAVGPKIRGTEVVATARDLPKSCRLSE